MSAPRRRRRAGSEFEFWRFSLELYGRPGVAAACLGLQDKGRADVNLLFFLLYLADRGRLLDPGDVARIDAAVRVWREDVVCALRELRRRMKSGVTGFEPLAVERLRERVKALELTAEKLEQQMLEQSFPPLSTGTECRSRDWAAAAHLEAYSELLGGLRREQLDFLLAAFGAERRRG
jgi:uncharacterized protein (TIGR02444 family)